MGSAILFLVHSLIQLVILLVIVNAVLSWLIAFDVINIRNRFVGQIARTVDALTDPLLRPIRRFLPNMGGIDISPIILILLLQALLILIDRTIAGPLIAVAG